jgi:hypothetical protein
MRVAFDFHQHNEIQPGADLGGDDWEFCRAMAAFQKASGRRFPSWREVLQVARGLGYRKPTREESHVHAENPLEIAAAGNAESGPAADGVPLRGPAAAAGRLVAGRRHGAAPPLPVVGLRGGERDCRYVGCCKIRIPG